MLEEIQQDLAASDLLPDDHLVDNGYITDYTLVSSRERYGLNLIGPVADDTS